MLPYLILSLAKRPASSVLIGSMLAGAWLMLPLACCAQAQQANPAWFSQPQFFLEDYGGDFPSQTPVSALPFTGQIWGGYIVPNTDSDSFLEQVVDSWHSQGSLYFFAEDLYARIDGSTPADWDSFRMRNLDGAYINLGGFYAPQKTPLYSLSSPVFQQALLAGAIHAVDLGADGLTFDDVANQLIIMFQAPDASGSFDMVTMAAFRAYLQQKYSASTLMSKFGIADIESFNFGAYIKANSLTKTWNQVPLTGLSIEFYLFKRQESLNFLRDLVSSTKQYAMEKYGRNFLFEANDNDYPLGYFINDAMDFEYDERPYIRGGDHPFGAVDVKAWKGWKSPNLVYPSAMAASWGPSAAPYLSGPTVNLERVLIADIYAAGGIRVSTIQLNLSDGTPEPVDLSVVKLYANFILSNPQLMTQTTTGAKTLLLQSAASLSGGTLPSPAETNPYTGYTDYIGTGRLLLDSGITYDSLFLPDTSYSRLPPLTLSALRPYNVVIAPYSWAFDDNQVSVLLGYAREGGTLIIDGHFANSEPDGTPASRPNIQTILATRGAHPYGSGTIMVTNALFGVQYETNEMSTQRTARAAFQSFLAPYVSPDVVVTQPPAQIYEPGITPFFYRDRNGNALVHLVNYDYDDSTDQFYTKTNIQIQVHVGSQVVNAVILRSPDIVGAQSLSFTRSGDVITVTVPEVDAWDVLYFEPSTLAPVISSASPAASLSAVAGDSLSFSVGTTDPDRSPLTYIWSVNGQVVPGAFSASYDLQLPLTASGIYTITVSVTDGWRTTETSWSVNVAAYHQPRVLFDESHGEGFSINLARASQINPQNPQFASYALLAQAMQPRYQISRLTTGPITAQVLNGADVLVLAEGTPLTTAENQAISTFVQGGGALIYASGGGLNPSINTSTTFFDPADINTLIGGWGITVDDTLILSPVGAYFYASSYADSPALPSNPMFKTSYGGSLLISPPAVSLVQTDATAWKSLSGQATQQPGDPNGPFTLIGVTQFGSGRVWVVTADSAFDDGFLEYTPSDTAIFLAGLAWVSAAVNPPPPPPAASKVSVLSVVNAASFATPVSPGSWITLSGQNLANVPATGQTWTSGDFNGKLLPTALGGTSVFMNGRPAAVEFISPNQVNVLAPDDAHSGRVPIQVISPSGIAGATVNLQPLAPALFTVVAGGTTYAAAVGTDGAAIGPPGQIPGARAAKSGEIVEFYGTGFGDTNPHQPADELVNVVAPLVNTVSATVCGQVAAVSYAGLVAPGLDQINVKLPDVGPGNCPVQLVVGGIETQIGVVIPVGE